MNGWPKRLCDDYPVPPSTSIRAGHDADALVKRATDRNEFDTTDGTGGFASEEGSLEPGPHSPRP